MKRFAIVSTVVGLALCGFVAGARAEAMTKSVVGQVAAIDLKAASPSVKISAGAGKSWTLAIDPKTVTVKQAGKAVTLDQVKVGQKVKARYTVQDGKQVISSLELQ